MRRLSIAGWLTGLFLTLIIPTIGFMLFLINQLDGSDRATLERQTLREAISTAKAVEPIIQGMSATLKLLISNPELTQNQFEEFHARAKYALTDTDSFVIVVGENNEQLLNTRVNFRAKLKPVSSDAGVAQALKSGKPHVTDVFFGKTSSKWVFNVIAPLQEQRESLARAVITTKNADELSSIPQSSVLADRWLSLLVDGQGRVIASSNDEIIKVGELFNIPNNMKYADLSSTSGLVPLAGKEEQLLSYSHITGSDWRSIVFGPISTAQAPLSKAWKSLITGGLLLIVFSITALYFFANYLRRGIQRIATMANKLAGGEIVSPATSRVTEIDIVAKALSSASFDRSEKDSKIVFIMRELAHRTKNLIAVVSSIIRQTARNVSTKEEMVSAVNARVLGLGHSIDLLTAKDWGGVPLKELIERQLSTFGTLGKNITVDGPNILLKAEAVQHLGMAFHELSTNAAKYGALSKEEGRLALTWIITQIEDSSDLVTLTWKETGGPKTIEPMSSGFGSQIIERHTAAAFSGKAILDFDKDGLVWSLTAPLDQLGEHCQKKPVDLT